MTYPQKSILFVGNHLSISGRNMGMGEELATHLEKRGWFVILASRKMNQAARLVDMLWIIFSQRKKYLFAKVDIFSGPAFIWAYLSALLIKLLKKPLIISLHGGNLPLFASRYPKAVKNLLSWANKVIAPSSYLIQKLKIYRSDIQLIPNGLDISDYPFRLRESPQPQLVWLRAFHQIYNPSLAPKVIKIMERQKFFPRLLMVGPDKGDGSLQQMLQTAQELGVENRIEVIQGVRKERVPEILNRGDIFINTTNIDNTPVSVVEAMACGCCIVTTNVGGIPFLLEDGMDALLVPPNDPDAMAAAVIRILTETDLAARLSGNARKKVEQFDWSIILPQWEKIFTEVIEKAKS